MTPPVLRARPVTLVVTGSVLVCAGGVVAVGLLTGWRVLPGDGGWPAAAMLVGLLVATVLAELAYVRVPHGDQTEDLTLIEAVVVADVLLLPPLPAALVPVAGLGLAALAMRRPPVKALFNLAALGSATTAMLAVTSALGIGTDDLRGVAGLTLGTLAFAAVNLGWLALVLRASGGAPVRQVLREEWRLSAFMALGNAGVAALAVSAWHHSPALLPFTALPVLALLHAYRSAAQVAVAAERSGHLDRLGRTVLEAGSAEEAMLAGAEVVRSALGAQAVAVRAEGMPTAVAGRRGGAVVAVPVGEGGRLEVHGASVDPSDPLLVAVAETLAAAARSLRASDALRAESAKLQAVVDHSSDAIVVLDDRGVVRLWSAAAERLTGRTAREVAAAQWAAQPGGDLGHLGEGLGPAFVALGDLLGLQDALPVPTAAEPESDALTVLRRPDGEPREVRLSMSGQFGGDGRLERLVVIGHDITRDRRLNRMKDDFVATVSHELRTPLTPIKGYAKLLAAQGERFTAERRQHVLGLIEDRADHLARLVDDLLVASRLHADGAAALRLSVGDHEVRALVEGALAGVAGLDGRLELELPDAPLVVRCDPTRFTQCLTNLASNAVKYSAPGTPVHVTVAADGDDVEVRVRDHGPGIPVDELERVFERFHRVEDAMTARTGGTGLGLYIARELARAMAGDITVESARGVGSCFTLSVRRAAVLAVSA